jgi:hypothetical protein
MAAGRKTAELASEPWQIGHGTPTVRIRVGLSHSFCETRTGGGRCSPTGPEPTSVNIAVTGGNLYPARCCCLLLSNCRIGDCRVGDKPLGARGKPDSLPSVSKLTVTSMKWLMCTLRVVCLTALALILVTIATVQFQQRLLRYRAEQLMADMHQVRLYQSTWPDAQRIMNRWGAWGHYDGTCTAAQCGYEIALTDISYRKFGWLMQHGGFRVYSLFGGRATRLSVSFTVKDGTLWRETAGIAVTATPELLSAADEFPLTLRVLTKSRQRLRRTEDDWWIMGADNQLAEHPYYKAGRPGGCEINCEEAVVTYSTRTPPAEIDRLTSFNLSCLTQFSSCIELEQLLPAAKDWGLYHEKENAAMQEPAGAPKPCDIPLWALARDARYALVVEGIATKNVKKPGITFLADDEPLGNGPDFKEEEDQVRTLTILKGAPPWDLRAIVLAHPYGGTQFYPDFFGASEHLLPGKRYIVFPIGDDRRDQALTRESPIALDPCGVWEDTPENRRELDKGFAQNDGLREGGAGVPSE